jgi:hypothetical protein
MSEAAQFLRASFTPQTGPARGTRIEVHFNPASLRYNVTNTLARTGSGDSVKQFVSQATGKLAMELVFDTTNTGEDVRSHTSRIEAFMRVTEGNVPPIVQFDWGSYRFQGMLESYSETLDFFAPSGVPLRATVNISLANQDKVFDPRAGAEPAGSDALEIPSFGAGFGASVGFGFSAGFSAGGAIGVSAGVSAGAGAGASVGFGASAVAAAGGNPRAARAIAAANSEESVRFSSGASLTVGGGPELRPAAAFSPGAGTAAGSGAGVSGSGSVSGSVSGSAGAGLAIGGSASAGVSASEGAFAGLRAAAAAGGSGRIDTGRLLAGGATTALATDRGASFSLGGKAEVVGSGSLGADVSGGGLRGRIRFEPR